MHIKTLLNYTTKYKRFVFQDSQLCRDTNRILVFSCTKEKQQAYMFQMS